jgi:putative endonuclease
VKTRSNTYFGEPEEAVDYRKSNVILNTADTYLQDFPWEGPIRFDIVSICKIGKNFEIVHLEDALG